MSLSLSNSSSTARSGGGTRLPGVAFREADNRAFGCMEEFIDKREAEGHRFSRADKILLVVKDIDPLMSGIEAKVKAAGASLEVIYGFWLENGVLVGRSLDPITYCDRMEWDPRLFPLVDALGGHDNSPRFGVICAQKSACCQ